MTARYATRDALSTYLRLAGEPRPLVLICRYMQQMHRVSYGATRTQLWRLHRDGKITNPQPGYYQWSGQ